VVLPKTLAITLTEEERVKQREARTQGVHGVSSPRVERRGSIPTRWSFVSVQDVKQGGEGGGKSDPRFGFFLFSSFWANFFFVQAREARNWWIGPDN